MRTTMTITMIAICQMTWIGAARAQYQQQRQPLQYAEFEPGPTYVEAFCHDSTVFGNYMTGLSRAARSLGEMQQRQSLAAINYQVARGLRLDNSARNIAWGNAKRAIEREGREMRVAARRLERYEIERQEYAAAQLLGTTIQHSQGGIPWPEVLQRPNYAANLKAIEQGVSQWMAAGRVLAQDERLLLKRRIKETEELLRKSRSTTTADERALGRSVLHKLAILIDVQQPELKSVALASTGK